MLVWIPPGADPEARQVYGVDLDSEGNTSWRVGK